MNTKTIIETSWGGTITVYPEMGKIVLSQNCNGFIIVKKNSGEPGVIGPDMELNIDVEILEERQRAKEQAYTYKL